MAQVDQTVQNATFPTVRADINNNLAALFTDSSGNTAPSVTVAFQDWIDTSGANPLWKKRNAANNAWITVATITGSAIAFEGTLPSQTGNAGEYLTTDGTVASWAALALGATLQEFTSSGTYTPTAGKTSFLVFCTGGGGGGGGARGANSIAGGGGGGGTAVRMYNSVEMGSTAAVTIGGAGAGGGLVITTAQAGGAGGTSTFDPDGSGQTITGFGGSGGSGANANSSLPGAGGSSNNTQFAALGQKGSMNRHGGSSNTDGGGLRGVSFWAAGIGSGGEGASANDNTYRAGTAGTAGGVFILEF